MKKKQSRLMLYILWPSLVLLSASISYAQQLPAGPKALTLTGDSLSTVLIGSVLKVRGSGFSPFDTIELAIYESNTEATGVDTTVTVLQDGTFRTALYISSAVFAGKEGVYLVQARLVSPDSSGSRSPLRKRASDDVRKAFLVLSAEIEEIVGEVLIIDYDVGETSSNRVPLNLWAGLAKVSGEDTTIYFARQAFISNYTDAIGEGPDLPPGVMTDDVTVVGMEKDNITVCWLLQGMGTDDREVLAKFWIPDAAPEYSTRKRDTVKFVADSAPDGPVSPAITVFLEGSYDADKDSMRADLKAGSDFPHAQPYSAAPWEYEGTEWVVLVPDGVVDWILAELRTSTAPESRVARRAGFIKQDGTIVDTDGSSPLLFEQPAGDYYVVLHHRNHLAIMTEHAITLTGATSSCCDFAALSPKVYGTDAMVVFPNGRHGMYAVDADSDSRITSTDFNDFLPAFVSGRVGYYNTDWNLDRQTTSSDFNLFLPHFTSGAMSRVPQPEP